MKNLIMMITFCVSAFMAQAKKIIPLEADTSRNKAKESAENTTKNQKQGPKATKSTASAKSIQLVKDTLSESVLRDISDSALVLPIDIPMPVDETSVFENALYKKRLDSLQKEIPLPYNAYVQSYINLYLYKRRGLVERLLGEGSYYFPIYDKVLKAEGVPLALKYLPIIESALNPFAVSRAGATGQWQFMYATGKIYGLEINNLVDERRDPYKASEAACRYFKDMHDKLGDWLLVIASYNCGRGNVERAIRRAGGQRDFWAIKQYLPKETRSYVPAFIAAAYIMSYAKYHGLKPLLAKFSTHNDTVMVSNRVALNNIAKGLGIDPLELRLLNPQYKRGIINGSDAEPQEVMLPVEKKALYGSLKEKFQEMPGNLSTYQVGYGETERTVKTITLRYKVRHGETLSTIADKYNCQVQDLKVWNHLHSKSVMAGQRLVIKTKTAGRRHHFAARRSHTHYLARSKARKRVVYARNSKKHHSSRSSSRI